MFAHVSAGVVSYKEHHLRMGADKFEVASVTVLQRE